MKNKKIKILELFGGIGAPRKALENIGYEVDSTYVEIDKPAVKSYNAIYGENCISTDVKDFDAHYLKDNIDVVVGGFPCQPFSIAGKGDGVKDSRGLLVFDMLRIIEECNPTYIVSENVKQIMSDKHKDLIELYIEKLSALGYYTTVTIINSYGFNTPQTRRRVFITSSKLNKPNLDSIKSPMIGLNSFDFIDRSNNNYVNTIMEDKFGEFINTNSKTAKLGYYGRDYTDKRVYRLGEELPTLTASNMYMISDGIGHRKLTALESFRLMGFDDEDYYKCIDAGCSDNSICTQAGNSIVVPVLEEIFKVLLDE